MSRVRIAIVGAGLIGRRHAEAAQASPTVELAAIVDPADQATAFASAMNAQWFGTLEDLLSAKCADGVILATPNQHHVEGGLACISAGTPVLVEKPLAGDVEGGRRLVEAAQAANTPLATGHHRRHNPIIARAKEMVASGRLGAITTAHASTWFRKPDDYFKAEWRTQPGAGPVYLNLIHDIDLLLHLCGPIEEVSAMTANAARGFAVEDTAVATLRFANGALGTLTVSDAVAAPWSWELTARENPAYPATDENSYLIGGTKGSLALPSLAFWAHHAPRAWMSPISAERAPVEQADPLIRQVEQFAAVIRGEQEPLATGLDGLKALCVLDAILNSAATGAPQKPKYASEPSK